eukprot:CAMPEP_0117034534 /NCGR_PEP_ID=MMETSP0472-20121206/24577_1 /TAXON_ID=693140 ORGANISM="Tiarina fusus, Strain LIS" /NCGR_SAMPLE_ID=MMETSP0472 /ASSEMBLY_ACC=CAM_ASM_000603 /LENGTH=156 /DNA_ID=CAMNT_0004743725 /DNA_START=207 /DNA_END=673 /DNA_ORIENTATION=-
MLLLQSKLKELLALWNKVPTNTTKVVPLIFNSNNNDKDKDDASSSPSSSSSPSNMITITAHLGVSKLERFLVMATRWNGPVSAAIYIYLYRRRFASPVGILFLSRPSHQIIATTTYALVPTPRSRRWYVSYQQQYPYNVLRQIALDYVPSESYFLT